MQNYSYHEQPSPRRLLDLAKRNGITTVEQAASTAEGRQHHLDRDYCHHEAVDSGDMMTYDQVHGTWITSLLENLQTRSSGSHHT
jgi:hypothetical protein